MAPKKREEEEMTEFQHKIVHALNELGFGNGNTGKGALEGLTVAMCGGDPMKSRSVVDGLFAIAESIEKLAEAIGDRK